MTETETKHNSNLENINDIFKIPICYNDKVKKLNDNVITDLELVRPINEDEKSIYDNIFKPSNKLSVKFVGVFCGTMLGACFK